MSRAIKITPSPPAHKKKIVEVHTDYQEQEAVSTLRVKEEREESVTRV